MVDKKLNLNNTIKEVLPEVKETFIEFYGENYREMIEKKFQNCTYLGYSLPNNIELLLGKVAKDKSLELAKKFFFENGIIHTKENFNSYFRDFFNLRYPESCGLVDAFNYLKKENHLAWEEDKFKKFLKDISGHDEVIVGSDLYFELIDKIKNLEPSYNDMVLEFNEFYSGYNKYVKYIESCNVLKREIHKKYQMDYLEEISSYLDEYDKSLIANWEKYYSLSNLHCYDILCGFSYSNKTLIDAFSSESTEKINHSEEVDAYILNSIYNDRIAYFKKMGIDLGNDYEVYKNDDRCLNIFPSCEMADEIVKIRNDLSRKEEAEYITSTSLYQEQLKEIESLGLLDKNIAFNYKNIVSGITCINPNVKKVGDEYQVYSLLLFPTFQVTGSFDQHFVHECNHLVELDLISVDKEKYNTRCGWEFMTDYFNDNNNDDNDKREFEYLNEIMNEMISQEITTILHEKDIYLFDKKEESKIKYTSGYENYRFLVQDFYDKFRNDIIESRLTGDMETLYQKIGKDNLIALNQVVHKFADYFSGFKYYKLRDDLNNKVQSENVLFYQDCILERDLINQNINEVYSLYLNENVQSR